MEIKNFKNKLIESLKGNLLMYGLNLLFPLIITRIYGVEIFGSYIYSITIISMSLLIANLGMDIGLLYYIPKTGNKYVSASFLINILTSFITIIGLFLFGKDEIKPFLGLVWLLSSEQLFFSIYRAKQHIKEFFKIKAFIGILFKILISILLFFMFGVTLTNLIIATYVAGIISIIIYFYSNSDMFDKLEMKLEFINYSATIILGGVMSLLINYIDIVMIESMMSKKDVGLYKVGTELALLPSMFLMIINTVFPPIISKLCHEGKLNEVRELYETLTRYLFLISSITIALILIFWKPILLLYGVEYLDAKMVLIYRSIGQLVNASVGSVWYIVLMTGHPKIRFFGVLASAIINISLNYLLIPKLGIDGAAFASMVSTIFINILGFFIVKKILKAKVYYIF